MYCSTAASQNLARFQKAQASCLPPYVEIADFMKELIQAPWAFQPERLKFSIFNGFARSGEVRGATWVKLILK